MSSVSRQRRRPKQKQYRKKRIPTRIDSDSVSKVETIIKQIYNSDLDFELFIISNRFDNVAERPADYARFREA